LLVAMIQGLLTGSALWLTSVPYSALCGVVTVFGALGLILDAVLFALLAALIDLYDEEYRLSRKE
jgi:predicted PurR-regulated permease PerM